MKIGIVTDVMYEDRAYENISKKFQTEWLSVDFPDSPLLDDVTEGLNGLSEKAMLRARGKGVYKN